MEFEKELNLKKNQETTDLINQIMGKLDAIKDYIEGLAILVILIISIVP